MLFDALALPPVRVDDALVVVDRVQRRHARIAPALIDQQLAAVREERLHVRIGRVHDEILRRVAPRHVLSKSNVFQSHMGSLKTTNR